tara:strand:- start:14237 stop:17425 length:3189 start_codon:yes stop_codon:yes gene_type:complete
MVKIKLKTIEYYPTYDDTDFQKKIYKKKEFYENRYEKETRKTEEICNPSNFKLFPTQRFLKNFMSIETPFNGILIFHGTGVGKSCSAISIAENFIPYIKKYNKKIIILSSKSIKKNFKTTIFNLKKDLDKKTPDESVQCTGNKYALSSKDKYLTYNQKQKLINKKIKSNYKFYGYGKFANLVKSKTGWSGQEEDLTDTIIKFIGKEYSNTVIIIDEVHNIKKNEMDKKDKQTPYIITTVMKYSKNIKLVLMSATPMFDKPQEIIFITNLLLLNDKRDIISQKDIFDKERNANLLPGGREKLIKALNGYVSYVRGENPYTYPVKIYPSFTDILTYNKNMKGETIDLDKKLRYNKTFNCLMKKKQLQLYDSITENSNAETSSTNDNLIQISNIVYPTNKSLTYGKSIAYELGETFLLSSNKVKNTRQISYNKAALMNAGKSNETSFLDEKYIQDYSTKFHELLKIIKKSKGPILIYSYYVWSGVIPLALFLEQNGVERYTIDNEQPLLNYKNKSPPLSYDDGTPVTQYKKKLESFKSLKYTVVANLPEFIKMTPHKASEIINSATNKDGNELKIIIGTKIISEGIDFSGLRQIHILDPWYNLSRNQQIIGRGLRSCSHVKLPEIERNVEIIQYAAITNSKNESADMYRYRLAEEKDIKIKNVERVMKEVAADCLLNRDRNIISSSKTIKMISASGEKIKYKFGFEPFSADCDYKKNCSYKCVSSVKTDIIPDDSTFSLNFAETYIKKIIKDIKNLYRFNIYYTVEQIKNSIDNSFDDLYIYIALDKLLKDKNNIIFDKYDREGYLIYRGDYYIFQPNEIRYLDIPVYYRQTPLEYKVKQFSVLDYVSNKDNKLNIKNNITNSKTIFELYDTVILKYKEFIKYFSQPIIDTLLYEYLLDRMEQKNIVTLFNTALKNKDTKYKIIKNIIMGLSIKKDKKMILKIYNTFYKIENNKLLKTVFKTDTENTQYNIIYGTYLKSFKLLDNKKYTDATTLTGKKSQRSMLKGIECKSIKINELKNIYSRLSKKTLLMAKKNDLCFFIEIYLRSFNKKNKPIYFKSNIIHNL